MLNEEFIDENVLILKKDGTDNEYFALANENAIPDFNIPKYLNALKCKRQEVLEQKLLNGYTLQINFARVHDVTRLIGKGVELIDDNYNSLELADGSYISFDRKLTYHIRRGKLYGAQKNVLFDSVDNKSYEIIGGNTSFSSNKNKNITINGATIEGYKRIVDKMGFVYLVKESIISNVHYIGVYKLSQGYKVKIEHKKEIRFSKGDIIVYSEPINPIPDGNYAVRGTFWKKIKIKDSKII